MLTRHVTRVGVGTVVVDSDNRILLGWRIKKDETPSWCLPGGAIEAGESFEQAALRETSEESGISQFMNSLVIGVCLNLKSEACSVTAAVVARCPEHTVPKLMEPDVFSEWRWFDADNLPEIIFPASVAVLSSYRHLQPPDGWSIYRI